MTDDTLSIKEAAILSNCDTSTLRRAAIDGNLKANKIGSYWSVSLSALREWKQDKTLHKRGRRAKVAPL